MLFCVLSNITEASPLNLYNTLAILLVNCLNILTKFLNPLYSLKLFTVVHLVHRLAERKKYWGVKLTRHLPTCLKNFIFSTARKLYFPPFNPCKLGNIK